MTLKELITMLLMMSEQHGPETPVRIAYGHDEGYTPVEDIDTVRYVTAGEFGDADAYVRIASFLEVDE